MKRALGQDGTKVFDEHAFGEKDIIPDGQRNEFEITNKGKKYISKKKMYNGKRVFAYMEMYIF